MVNIKIPKVVGFLMLMALLFAIGYLLPYTIVLGKAGLLEPEVSEQLNIYSNIMFFFLGMVLLYVGNLLWKQDNRYGNNIGIYNKDETIFKNFTYPQMTLLFLILFMGIFLLMNSFQILGDGFFGLKVLPQQFTPIDSLIVSTGQIPVAENSMAGFTIGILSLISTLIFIKFKVSPSQAKLYKYLIVILGVATFGYVWHQTAYAGSDIAGFIVAVFWGMGAFLSLLTGFFIPFLLMHMTNNFFIDFTRLYSNDVLFGAVLLLTVGLMGLYYYRYKGRLFPFR